MTMSSTDFLRERVAQEMGLEKWAVEGVVECVLAAKDKNDAVDLLVDFIGDAGKTHEMIESFFELRNAPAAPAANPPNKPSSTPAIQPQPKAEGAVGRLTPSGPVNSPAGPGTQQPGPGESSSSSSFVSLGSVKGKKGGGGTGGKAGKMKTLTAGAPLIPTREPCMCQATEHALVGNCLSCGKIICQQEGLGPCFYCGTHYAGRGGKLPTPATSSPDQPTDSSTSAQSQPSAAASSARGGSSSSYYSGSEGLDDAAAAARAVAAKDRLVLYDRTSTQRTAVIDDQSDFFAIDTNQWLTEEERAALRQQEAQEAEEEERKRKQVTLTFDLIGRQVMLADSPAAADLAAQADELAKDAELAAKASLAEYAQGGGRAAEGAQQAAAQIRMNMTDPRIKGTAPLFLPNCQNRGRLGTFQSDNSPSTSAPVSSGGGQGGSTEVRKERRGGKGSKGAGKGAGRIHSRLQDDDLFGRSDENAESIPGDRERGGHHSHQHQQQQQAEFSLPADPRAEGEAYLAARQSVSHGGGRAEKDEAQGGSVFDICEAGGGGKVPARRLVPGARGRDTNPAQVLQEGLVVLRGWLSLEEQAALIAQVRELGVGPGGFEVPQARGDATLALQMMCLGYHWDPKDSGAYHKSRQSDGAAPPALPEALVSLARRARQAADQQAQEAGHPPLPDMTPDVCLVNFYPPAGKLGMHQDYAESAPSLARGAPVVSLSLGDAADFHWSPHSREDMSSKVVLESGDLIVFGGKSRLIYHGVTHIHGNTAPKQLIEMSGIRPGRLNLTFREK